MRFVKPDVVRIDLEFGDGSSGWIDVKKELTAGEEKRFRTAGFKRLSQSGSDGRNEVDIDWSAMAFARAEAYLADWSEKRKLNADTIRALAKDDFDVIDAAIQLHIEAMEQEKKATSGAPTLVSH
ncbi:MAG: hypothetical protein V4529_17575 [Gemmatimonadota bacterium]